MWDIAIFIINKIKEAINSVKSVAEEIKTNTAGNTTASASGTLSQKLTHIIEVLTTGSVKEELATIKTQTTTGNISVVKSIQRGTVMLSGSTTVEINEINPDKSIIVLIGPSYSSGTYGVMPHVVSLDSTSFVLGSTNVSYNPTITWQVIEFY